MGDLHQFIHKLTRTWYIFSLLRGHRFVLQIASASHEQFQKQIRVQIVEALYCENNKDGCRHILDFTTTFLCPAGGYRITVGRMSGLFIYIYIWLVNGNNEHGRQKRSEPQGTEGFSLLMLEFGRIRIFRRDTVLLFCRSSSNVDQEKRTSMSNFSG